MPIIESTNQCEQRPENESPKVFSHDLILTKDVNFFGRTIRRGSVFKPEGADWYILWENKNGIIMHCPAIKIHFTSIRDEYFVKMYQ